MSNDSSPPFAGRRFPREIWALGRIYWTSPDARMGALLLVVAIALELGTVYGNVLLADSQRRIFDALQNMDMAAFVASLGIFAGFVMGFLLVSAYRVYARQVLEMRWRRSLTAYFVTQWIDPQTYSQDELHPRQLDNPDQRIAEDVRIVVSSALGLSLSLLAAVVTFLSFAGMLWTLSAHFPVPFRGPDARIPGLMVWVAIAYVLTSTALTHVVGRRLVPLGIARQRVEADFRFSLMRFRENALAVTLARGETMERRGARDRFDAVVANWGRLISAQRDLALVTTGAGQISGVVPLLIGAPAYFAGHFTLGSLVQTRIAYEQVGGALAWFVYAYQEIAQWRASVERLTTLILLIESTRADLSATTRVHVESVADERLHIVDLRLDFPDGRVLLDHANAVLVPGERIAVIGPAGSGKTILFRALAGTWPYGHGSVQFPATARAFFLPQRPYLPIGTLREIITFPAPGNAFPDDKVKEVIHLLNLDHLLHRLDELESWEQRLSTDEQQRLSFARVLLQEPDWLFIDDATAAVDEIVERRMYDLLIERLPHATVVTLTHRASVAQYHSRRWSIVPHAGAPASLLTG